MIACAIASASGYPIRRWRDKPPGPTEDFPVTVVLQLRLHRQGYGHQFVEYRSVESGSSVAALIWPLPATDVDELDWFVSAIDFDLTFI